MMQILPLATAIALSLLTQQLRAEEGKAADTKKSEPQAEGLKGNDKKYDKDGDGKLNDEEKAARKEAMKKMLDDWIKKYDKDGDGKLNDEEKATAKAAKEAELKKQTEEKMLKKYDKDGDGKLNDEEKAACEAACKAKEKKDAEKANKKDGKN